MVKNALNFGHELLQEVIQLKDTVVDATMGNGHDTLFLAQLVGNNGQVFAYDIQEKALENTKKRLTTAGELSQCHLLLKSHDQLEDLPEEIAGAIFNLGYLPSGDKRIITKSDTTLKSLTTLLEKLKKSGRIVLVLYYGHPGGQEEKEAVLEFCKKLPQKEFSVIQYSFMNQIHEPPILIVIEKNVGL